ncbi:hypothetical protein D3C86_1409600 [compost metagenome]
MTIVSTVTNLLWPREAEIRLKTLQSYNPYRQGRTTDPGVVRHLFMRQATPLVHLADPGWQSDLAEAFQTHGVVRLSAEPARGQALRQAIVQLVATPIDVGVLQFFPTVEKVERIESNVIVTLTLREQL